MALMNSHDMPLQSHRSWTDLTAAGPRFWGIGAAFAMSLLYHGVAQMMRPEQTKGFGLYLVSMVLIVFFTGFSHFIAIQVLHGRLLDNLHL